MKNSLARALRSASSQEGSALIITAIAIVMLIAVTGAGIDLGRQQLLHNRLQQSSDAAALAGALYPAGSDATDTANRYFALNYSINAKGTYMGSTTSAKIDADLDDVKVSASGNMKDAFVGQNHKGYTVAGASTVGISVSAVGADLLLVMDNTDSMKSKDVDDGKGDMISRIQALTHDAELLDQVFLKESTNSQIGIVTWQSYVDQTLDLTGSYSQVYNLLASMPNNLTCCTDSSPGMSYALNTLSTKFRDGVPHAVVFLTDGLNNTYMGQKDPKGVQSDAATLASCNQFKTADMHGSKTIIFTIGFGTEAANNQQVRNFLASCASGDPATNLNQYFFLATTDQQLQDVFKAILGTLQQIRITH